jgi:hypothetical protein
VADPPHPAPESDRPSARDYYFTAIAPHEHGRNYQAVHQAAFYEPPSIARVQQLASDLGFSVGDDGRVRDFVPRFSNEALLDHLISELKELLPEPLQQRLEGVFVAKLRDFGPNAASVRDAGSYYGDLILYNAGIADACGEHAILFAEFLDLIRLRRSEPTLDPKVAEDRELALSDHLIQLTVATIEWRATGRVSLHEETVLPIGPTYPMAVNLQVRAEKFILAHEIAHHLLGHVGRIDQGSDYLAAIPRSVLDRQTLPSMHAMEFAADALAVRMMTGSIAERPVTRQGRFELLNDSGLGALLTMLVISRLTGDRSSTSHPSAPVRAASIRRLLDYLGGDEVEFSMGSQFDRFAQVVATVPIEEAEELVGLPPDEGTFGC